MGKAWIEVALNGAWSRGTHPSAPQSSDEIVEEAVACVEAGAAIVHAHTTTGAADGRHGRLEETVDYLDRIKARVDAIVYPSLLGEEVPGDPAARFAPMRRLAERGLLDWAAFDPGSFNFYALDPDELGGPTSFQGDGVLAWPNDTLEAGAAMCAEFGIVPTFACFEPGFARLGAALHRRHPGMPSPIYRVMFSSALSFGLPPSEWAVEVWARHMAEVAPGAPWMIAGLAVDVLPLVPRTLALGGHVRVGVEDHPFHCATTNLEWVRRAVAAVEAAGLEPASAAEVRAAFADPAARAQR